MHRLSSTFVLAYHGCEKSVAEKLLANTSFIPSQNDYDWLGSGIYFWEANPKRALEWAIDPHRNRNKTITEPYVVGAIVELGHCLDLVTTNGIEAVKTAYADFAAPYIATGKALPKNDGGQDRLRRRLDCAVINHLHELRKQAKLDEFDTVRGVFIEGDEIYTDSGFKDKTHIQICVRKPNLIKGVFRVPK